MSSSVVNTVENESIRIKASTICQNYNPFFDVHVMEIAIMPTI